METDWLPTALDRHILDCRVRSLHLGYLFQERMARDGHVSGIHAPQPLHAWTGRCPLVFMAESHCAG